MLYERKITYLDYNIRGERCGVGGFIKLERRDDVCNITLQINTHETLVSYGVKVNLIGEQEKELCTLDLIGGKAVKRFKEENISDIGGTGIAYDEMAGVRILLSPEREIWGKIRDRQSPAEGQVLLVEERKNSDRIEESVIAAEAGTYNEDGEIIAEEGHIVAVEQMQYNESIEKEGEQEESPVLTAENEEQEESPVLAAEIGWDCENQTKEEHTWEVTRCEQQQPRALWVEEDKWHQLWEIYPHISPFQDEREYLSIGPNDFVILPGKYFRMANNSFLLHGYHNYRHLVLKKINQQGEEKYYIGVPGNFYDREKQVAVMFGFEGFESLKEPASPGDYGYYMMRVEL